MQKRFIMSLSSFFNPACVAVVGVSADPEKLGAVVFENIIQAGFRGRLYGVNPKLAGQKLSGKSCYARLQDIPEPVDLAVIVVPARFTLPVIEDAAAAKARNISIITAGFAEAGQQELESQIASLCLKNNINLLGPNCLGHISTFNNLNASFADGFPARGNVAFISQSGAYCSAMMDWAAEKGIGFSHFISVGNKALLAEDGLLDALRKDTETTAFVFYLESLKNGRRFMKILKEVSATKPVVILEPGKSQKAQAASLSHTGSLAPNYRVLEIALQQAGAIQARTTRELFGLLELLQYARHRRFDGALALLTNAGGVGVQASDMCEEAGLELDLPSPKTQKKLRAALPAEASLGNPIDVIGDARADRYEAALRILCESGEYPNILVLLTPQRVTECAQTAEAVIRVARAFPQANIYTSFIGGARVREARQLLEKNHILTYEYPADAIALLGLLKKQMAFRALKTIPEPKAAVPQALREQVAQAKKKGLASLPQETVNALMRHFKIDCPKSATFTDAQQALAFCRGIFPAPVVLKLSAPDALHKTEMKGIYLNIADADGFKKAWKGLADSIAKFSLKNACVLIQEMIAGAAETIIGVNTDKTFGRVMVFGSGGIYTEVLKDTALRLLPANDFEDLIRETKIGAILNGVRGEEPKAVGALADTLRKIQSLVFAFPEITAVDGNPVFVTRERAIVVDFKLLLK